MRTFRHRRGRILFEIFAALLFAGIAAERWVDGGSIAGLAASAALVLYSLYRGVMLFARNPALAFGDRGIEVGGLFKVSRYSWTQFRDIRESVWKRPYIPFMHFLPKERQYIELQFHSGTVKLRPDMIQLPSEGAKQIISGVRSAQIAALGESGAATARLGGASGLRPQAPVSGVQAERFSRLGIGTGTEDSVEPPQVAAESVSRLSPSPGQPVFGRKAS